MAAVVRTPKSLVKKTTRIYSDILSAQLFNPDTFDLSVIDNEAAVKQSIVNLVQTIPGERFFEPNIGSGIYNLLFENMTPQTTLALKEVINSCIENFEPRASIVSVVVTPDYDNDIYNISVVFNVINRNDPVSLDLILNRIR